MKLLGPLKLTMNSIRVAESIRVLDSNLYSFMPSSSVRSFTDLDILGGRVCVVDFLIL